MIPKRIRIVCHLFRIQPLMSREHFAQRKQHRPIAAPCRRAPVCGVGFTRLRCAALWLDSHHHHTNHARLITTHSAPPPARSPFYGLGKPCNFSRIVESFGEKSPPCAPRRDLLTQPHPPRLSRTGGAFCVLAAAGRSGGNHLPPSRPAEAPPPHGRAPSAHRPPGIFCVKPAVAKGVPAPRGGVNRPLFTGSNKASTVINSPCHRAFVQIATNLLSNMKPFLTQKRIY